MNQHIPSLRFGCSKLFFPQKKRPNFRATTTTSQKPVCFRGVQKCCCSGGGGTPTIRRPTELNPHPFISLSFSFVCLSIQHTISLPRIHDSPLPCNSPPSLCNLRNPLAQLSTIFHSLSTLFVSVQPNSRALSCNFSFFSIRFSSPQGASIRPSPLSFPFSHTVNRNAPRENSFRPFCPFFSFSNFGGSRYAT